MNSTILGTLLIAVSSVAFAQWEFHSFKGERTEYRQSRKIEDTRYAGNPNVCAHETAGGYSDGKCYSKATEDKIVIYKNGASAIITVSDNNGEKCEITGDGVIGTPDELTLVNVHTVGKGYANYGNSANQCLITIEDQRTGVDVLNNGKCTHLCGGADISIINAQEVK